VKHIVVGDAKIIILWMHAETPSLGGDRLSVTLFQVFPHQCVVLKGFVSTFGIDAGRDGRKIDFLDPRSTYCGRGNMFLQILSLTNKVRISFC
jgi:hypothetical protein